MFSIKLQNILQTKIFNQPEKKPISNEPIYSTFKLPITYLDKQYLHTLSDIVNTDLELHNQENAENSMYKYILKPKHQFAYNLIPEWNKQFTNHIPFLIDSQQVIQNMSQYSEHMAPHTAKYSVDCDKIMTIWKDTKEDPNFLEKYCYMDWDMLKNLNNSSSFLQTISLIHMSSPVLSFIIPFIFLLFPFILLKIQKIPITFTVYLQVLKDIAKNHFIGKAISNIQAMSWDKIIYLVMMFSLYILQIYQNCNLCIRFYKNIHKINDHLCEMRNYLDYSIHSMESFVKINQNIVNYRGFCENTKNHCHQLKNLREELKSIQPFKPGFSKIAEIGNLLKCFYRIHSDIEFEQSIRYSIGFEGFINNIAGVFENFSSGNISHATFDVTQKCSFEKQYYPSYVDTDHVKNNFDLSKNSIITGPNASGKTTMLKTSTINVIFSQQFGCGFYKSCIINPYTHIHSYLNIPDTSGRDSLFQAESRRCKEIIDIILVDNTNTRHFCIFDELYSGTNPTEATKSAYAFLLYLSKYTNVDFILTTHYTSICKRLKKSKRIMNYKMDVEHNPESGHVKYTYKMKKGISKIQGAILILEEMKYPCEIIDEIKNY